jgi:hypothetical protein
VTRNIRRPVGGLGCTACPAVDIEELGIKVAPPVKVRDLQFLGSGLEPSGVLFASDDWGIGISKIPNRQDAG